MNPEGRADENSNAPRRFVDALETEARIDELIEGALEVCVASAFVDLGGARRFAALKQMLKEKEFANPYYWAPFVLFGDGYQPAPA